MINKIAVESTLGSIKTYLARKGFDVVNLDKESINMYDEIDAVIISGVSSDMLGMENTHTEVPVIEAEGLTPEEICERINRL